MEDWKQKLVDAVRKLLSDEVVEDGDARYQELREWLAVRQMKRLREITDPAHVVELMEMIDRWHDEDAQAQDALKEVATANPEPRQPTNPFIEETVRQTIRVGTFGTLNLQAFDHAFVRIELEQRKYRPTQLRALAKRLNDLADAHEGVYPPQQEQQARPPSVSKIEISHGVHGY